MPMEMENSALVHADVGPRFDAYAHKLRLHASDGGRLIDLVEQRKADRRSEQRAHIAFAVALLLFTLAAAAIFF
jgi:hypothetical protein